MSLVQVIQIINDMETEGLVSHYAIGGAVGATFYLEPVATLDVDIFVAFDRVSDQALISLQPIITYLTAKGGILKNEYIEIAGWPVQFLPPTSSLVEEALLKAVTKDINGLPTHVFTAEHLAAIALETGRAKDKARLLQFIESGVLDMKSFQEILDRHGLTLKWQAFENAFFKGKNG